MSFPCDRGQKNNCTAEGVEVCQGEVSLLVFQLWGSIHIFELSSDVDNTVTGHDKWQQSLQYNLET